MNPVSTVKCLIVLLLLLLTGGIVYASFQQSLWPVLPVLWEQIWFKITIQDFYTGIAIFSAWVIYREPVLWAAILWIIAFVLLGNVATLIYLLHALRGVRSADELNQFFHGKWRVRAHLQKVNSDEP